jgi:predicted CXXCH cytochrome family protein
MLFSRPRGALLLPVALAAVLALPAAAAAASDCLECHEKQAVGAGTRSVHAPFEENDCGSCHADHGDEERLMLVAEGNALCEDCHDSGDAGFVRAHGNVRGPKARCLTCHDPHRSAEEHLLVPNRHRPLAFGRCDPCHRYDGRLLKPVRELCLGCHAGEEFTRRISHTPVRRGECLGCHDPHASREESLLKARYAPGRAIKGPADVALCLGCHARETYFSAGADATLFRSGSRNYHALHLGAGTEQPLSCRACHEAHTSEEPRLVRRELDCGGVPCLKLEYRRTDSGGLCVSGCHASQSYAFGRGGTPIAAFLQAAAPPAPGAARAPATLPEPTSLERSINKGCVGCHEKAVKRFAKGRIHAPVRAGNCSACHLDHGPENRLVLLGREDRICARCHTIDDAAALQAHAGFPVAGSRCTECHDPHGGEAAGFLHPQRHPPFAEGDCAACHGSPNAGWKIVGGANEACRQCHDDVGTGKRPHTAIASKGCLGCHRAHAAREGALLREARPRLCFSCHPRPRFVQETVHDPVGAGDCASCHAAHGSGNERLLTQPYPLDQYVAFTPEGYGLCWQCHDEGALTDPARAGDTGFVDGTTNLHALHLRDRVSRSELGTRVQPGISCRNCHDPHATQDPRLVRRVLDCNGVPCLQVEFRKVGAGGKCLGGCHVNKSYLPAAGR